MQIVIDICEDAYNYIKANGARIPYHKLIDTIKNGTPLPKEHGRLIDADKLKLTQHDIHVEAINYRHRCISIENIDGADTIIEADKESEKNDD